MKDSDISSEESKSFSSRVQSLLLHERMKKRESVSRRFVGLLHAAREEKKVIKADKSIPALTRELLVINEDILPCTRELSKELEKNFNIPGLGIIIFGSNAHGGANIRKLAKTAESPDFDYVLCSDLAEIPWDQRVEISRYIKSFIANNKARFKLPQDFKTCEYYAGIECVRNFREAQNVTDFLRSREGNVKNIRCILLYYFQPSMPPELNQHNQQLILEALSIMFKNNHDEWERIVTSLVDQWQSIHSLKPKHFGSEGDKPREVDFKNKEHAYKKAVAEWERREEVSKLSNQAMSKPFEDLLMSTAKS